jgi:hypothetical protein
LALAKTAAANVIAIPRITLVAQGICSIMPRFFFHCHDRVGDVLDYCGVDLPRIEDAHWYALDSVRSIIADDVRRGYLTLDGRLDVTDADGATLLSLAYDRVFDQVFASRTGMLTELVDGPPFAAMSTPMALPA